MSYNIKSKLNFCSLFTNHFIWKHYFLDFNLQITTFKTITFIHGYIYLHLWIKWDSYLETALSLSYILSLYLLLVLITHLGLMKTSHWLFTFNILYKLVLKYCVYKALSSFTVVEFLFKRHLQYDTIKTLLKSFRHHIKC